MSWSLQCCLGPGVLNVVLLVRVSLHETRTRDLYRPPKRRVAITELPSVPSQKTNFSFLSQDESIL